MPELLTESFCERCGTRYTFETPEPEAGRTGRLKQARTLARGLRNFVLDDSLPLEAALADARRDDDRVRATQQLEAFHRTFNFCLDCRQYTCLDCWNEAEGRCLSCAPRPGVIEPAPASRLAPPELIGPRIDGHGPEAEAWPALAQADVISADKAAPAPQAPLEEVSLREAVEAAALAAVAPAPPTEPIVSGPPLARPASGEPAAEVPEPVPEPVAEPVEPLPLAASLAAEPLAQAGSLPVASGPANAEPMLAQPDEATPPPPPSWPPALPVAADLPPARPFPAAPPPPPATSAPWPPLLPSRPGEPSWPTGPSPLLPPSVFGAQGQDPAADEAYDPWAASAAQIPARSAGAGIRSCVTCGLALSSTAHFCRRCGSRQSS